jgi:hypothetical protein
MVGVVPADDAGQGLPRPPGVPLSLVEVTAVECSACLVEQGDRFVPPSLVCGVVGIFSCY